MSFPQFRNLFHHAIISYTTAPPCGLLWVLSVHRPFVRYSCTLMLAARLTCQAAQLPPAPDVTTAVYTPKPQPLQVERIPVTGGADLIVLLKPAGLRLREDEQGGPVPLVAVLRDTLGDTDASDDRLRYVWDMTSVRPTVWQRIASALPFFYWRVGSGSSKSTRDPAPVLDVSHANKPVFLALSGAVAQSLILDSQGMFIRSSSRALRGNAGDYRQAHVERALTALAEGEEERAVRAAFTPQELQQLQARLLLARQPLGGLVSEEKLGEVYERKRLELQADRGHNWELLRQRAEAEHLLFEPMFDEEGDARFALVSVAKQDVGESHPFDRKFLHISDPWTDARLKRWNGITLPKGGPWQPSAAQPDLGERIPLGLYSLDYPHIPLLVVDFRDARAARRKEIVSRTVTDITSGVLGLSYIANWYFFAGRLAFNFVTGRHGAARDRAARARAYEELRLILLMEDSWDPAFRDDVRKKLLKNSINPLGADSRAEIANAQHQFAQLTANATDPAKLPARLDRDRRLEMVPLVHSPRARHWLHVANFFSLGLYTHRETPTPELWARLAMSRRISTQKQYLAQVLEVTPQLDVAANLQTVGKAVQTLGEAHGDRAVPVMLGKVYARTVDPAVRRDCLVALRRLQTTGSAELADRLQATAPPAPVEMDVVPTAAQ